MLLLVSKEHRILAFQRLKSFFTAFTLSLVSVLLKDSGPVVKVLLDDLELVGVGHVSNR